MAHSLVREFDFAPQVPTNFREEVAALGLTTYSGKSVRRYKQQMLDSNYEDKGLVKRFCLRHFGVVRALDVIAMTCFRLSFGAICWLVCVGFVLVTQPHMREWIGVAWWVPAFDISLLVTFLSIALAACIEIPFQNIIPMKWSCFSPGQFRERFPSEPIPERVEQAFANLQSNFGEGQLEFRIHTFHEGRKLIDPIVDVRRVGSGIGPFGGWVSFDYWNEPGFSSVE